MFFILTDLLQTLISTISDMIEDSPHTLVATAHLTSHLIKREIHLTTGAIIGIAAGGFFGLLLVAALIKRCLKPRDQSDNHTRRTNHFQP